MLRRVSIQPKLVGLIASLLFMMVALAGYSYWQAERLSRRADSVASEVLPMLNTLAEVRSMALEQELLLERTLRHLQVARFADERVERDRTRFDELGARVRESLREAKQRARRGAAAVQTVEDAVELARLQSVLVILQSDHQDFQELAVEALDMEIGARGREQTETEVALARVRERQIVRDARDLRERLDELVVNLARFTERRAERVSRRQEDLHVISFQNLAFAGLAFLLGIMVAFILTRRIVAPLRELVRAADKVRGGDLDVKVTANTEDEVGELARSFNQMVEELRQRERMKEAFGKYLDPRIVQDLMSDEGALRTGAGERRVMTVYFSDLAGFSGISESLTPTGLVKVINRYLTLATEPISAHHGVVDKFIGDAVMAFWGPPFTGEAEHPRLACLAALEAQEQLDVFRRQLPELLGFRKGLPVIDVRVGICTGDLVVGNIGSEQSRSFTVMGDTVNVASRLEGVNKQYGTSILLSESTGEAVKDEFELREIDLVTVVGKKEPTRIYELLAKKGELEPAAAQLRDRFESALASYRALDFDAAESALRECEEIDSEDGPTRVFLGRIEALRAAPPAQGWNGVYAMTTK